MQPVTSMLENHMLRVLTMTDFKSETSYNVMPNSAPIKPKTKDSTKWSLLNQLGQVTKHDCCESKSGQPKLQVIKRKRKALQPWKVSMIGCCDKSCLTYRTCSASTVDLITPKRIVLSFHWKRNSFRMDLSYSIMEVENAFHYINCQTHKHRIMMVCHTCQSMRCWQSCFQVDDTRVRTFVGRVPTNLTAVEIKGPSKFRGLLWNKHPRNVCECHPL